MKFKINKNFIVHYGLFRNLIISSMLGVFNLQVACREDVTGETRVFRNIEKKLLK